MLQPIFISYAVSLFVLLFIVVIKFYYDKRHFIRLQRQIEELKKVIDQSGRSIDVKVALDGRREMLERQYELFIKTATYRDLRLLYNLQSDQVVNERTRQELVSQVLSAYYEIIRPMLDSGEFQQEDIFICLMFFMGFRTSQIAACLGVTAEAIRKRKSRLRLRLKDSEYDFFSSAN